MCYDSAELVKCEKCDFEVCEACVKQTYNLHSTPLPRCVKCATATPYHLLSDLVFYRSEYVRRVIKEIKEHVAKRIEEAKRVGDVKKSLPPVLMNKLGRERYLTVMNAVRAKTPPSESYSVYIAWYSLVHAVIKITKARTFEALDAQLETLDGIFECQDFSVMSTKDRPPRVECVCPWGGCAEGVVRSDVSLPSRRSDASLASPASLPSLRSVGRCRNLHETCLACRRPLVAVAGHSCLEEDVASVALVEKTSKACPSCFCQVEKSEGCDVMYCTKCGTGFDWVTLAIRANNVHNPHAYDTPVVSTRLTLDEREELEARLATLDDETADGLTNLANMYFEVVESPKEGLEDVSTIFSQIVETLTSFSPDASAQWKVQKNYEKIEVLVTDIWRRIYVERKLQDQLLETKVTILKAAAREIELDQEYRTSFGKMCLDAQPHVW